MDDSMLERQRVRRDPQGGKLLHDSVRVLRVRHRERRHDRKILRRITGDLTQRLIDALDAAVEPSDEHPDRRALKGDLKELQRLTQALLAGGERLMSFARGCDVSDLRDEMN